MSEQDLSKRIDDLFSEVSAIQKDVAELRSWVTSYKLLVDTARFVLGIAIGFIAKGLI